MTPFGNHLLFLVWFYYPHRGVYIIRFEVQSLGARVTEYLVVAVGSDGQSGLITAFGSEKAAQEFADILNKLAS